MPTTCAWGKFTYKPIIEPMSTMRLIPYLFTVFFSAIHAAP
jgi:hypothetical protein